MQFNKSLVTAALLTAGSLTVANAAPITSDQFDVLLTVNNTCTVVTGATQDINLGSVAAGQALLVGEEKTGSTVITTNCSVGSSAIIALETISTPNAVGTGNLKGPGVGAELIAYKLTTDAAGNDPWGTGADAVTTAAATSYAQGIATTVYATVTSTADVTPGAYKDTVNVSVTF